LYYIIIIVVVVVVVVVEKKEEEEEDDDGRQLQYEGGHDGLGIPHQFGITHIHKVSAGSEMKERRSMRKSF